MWISLISKPYLGCKLFFGSVEIEELNRGPGYDIGLVVEVKICTLYVTVPTPPWALNLATVKNFSHQIVFSGHCFLSLDPKGRTRTKGPSRLWPPRCSLPGPSAQMGGSYCGRQGQLLEEVAGAALPLFPAGRTVVCPYLVTFWPLGTPSPMTVSATDQSANADPPPCPIQWLKVCVGSGVRLGSRPAG